MFYCGYSMSDQVYYIEDYSAVAEFYDNILKLKEEDLTLFVMKENSKLFKNNKLMFLY